MIDVVHNQFLRNITKLRKSTPVYMLYAELGRVPIELHVKMRMINYWINLINGPETKISRRIYNIMVIESEKGKEFKWLNHIKQILISAGMPDIANQPMIDNPNSTKAKIKTALNDLYVQQWHSVLQESSKGRTYSIFKHDLTFESYLCTLNKCIYMPLLKFRTSNYKLPIETGRWDDTSIDERKCTLCENNDIGDDFHYLFKCPYFSHERANFLKPYFYRRPNIVKYKDLLSSKNKNTLLKLSKFVKIIMNKFS